MIKKALIFAAGKGTRLKPFTYSHPKALALVNDVPLLERNIKYLQNFGITEFVINVHHFGEQILEFLEKNNHFGAKIDISDEKLTLAKKLGADLTVNALHDDPGKYLKEKTGGMHGVLVTAVSPIAFKQALTALRRKGTISLNGLPPGSFDLPIFETVLNRYTVRGSIVGTRKDMQEAIGFAVEGKVKATVHAAKLEDINDILAQMKKGEIEGRIVLQIAE